MRPHPLLKLLTNYYRITDDQNDLTTYESPFVNYFLDNIISNLFRSRIAFALEDSTTVVKKISYGHSNNAFIGFSSPLNDGMPAELHYQTDSFKNLWECFFNQDCSRLINIHMTQPLTDAHLST